MRSIDIHGLQVFEAKQVLDHFMNTIPKGVCEVVVVHGYRGGTSLMTFVRKKYHHKRIKRVVLSLNQGETILELK